MKKIFMAIALCLIAVLNFNAYAQLNISSANSLKANVVAKEMYNKVISDNNGYWLLVRDTYSANMLKVFLGDNVESAKTSLHQLYDWAENSEKKTYLEIEQGDETITIYKTQNTQFMVSYGDATFCQEMFKSQMLKTLVGGGDYGTHSNRNAMFGYCSNNLLYKALENI